MPSLLSKIDTSSDPVNAILDPMAVMAFCRASFNASVLASSAVLAVTVAENFCDGNDVVTTGMPLPTGTAST